METQIAFIAICIASAASPGPGMLAVVSNSIIQDLKRTIPVIMGISTGLMIASILSNSWLFTIINTNEHYYRLMTWVCSSYILYLGGKAIYYSRSEAMIEDSTYTYKNGVLISLLNPKTLIFFGGLFPIFIDNNHSFIIQASLLTFELIVITLMIHVLLSLSVEKVSLLLKKHIILINRLTGLCFILLGLAGLLVH
ncbi:LysE family translocator [Vibrio sp. TRT 21S02]|uniref:LysE family translocator n=1 Tax=Vibrio sp. TRT 21S02 TaxID=3418507 RepID=UPI003CE96EFF